MQNRIEVDRALRLALVREFGERLRASLGEEAELPPNIRRQIERLREMEAHDADVTW
jgi:hypothetical protein